MDSVFPQTAEPLLSEQLLAAQMYDASRPTLSRREKIAADRNGGHVSHDYPKTGR